MVGGIVFIGFVAYKLQNFGKQWYRRIVVHKSSAYFPHKSFAKFFRLSDQTL
jgi:hypothetical protein